jgi:hypothetical protein
MESELKKKLEGSGRGLMEVLSWHMLEGTDKNTQYILCLGRESNMELPEYDARAILML